MSTYVIFSDKYHNLPDEKLGTICQYSLRRATFRDDSTADQRVWCFSNGSTEVVLKEMPNADVDPFVDEEIASATKLDSKATQERLGQLRSALLKVTTVLTATPSDDNPQEGFVQDVIGAFVMELRAVVKHDGAYYDQEPLLIINQDGKMDPKAKADPYDESDEVPLPFTLASLGKLGRLKTALADDPSLLSQTDKMGRTILHGAVQEGRCDVVRYLLENGADANARSKKVNPPLFQVYSADVIPVLHEFGADVSATDSKGNTPLHRAAKEGFEDVVPALLQIGADPMATNKDGKRPVDLVDAKFYPELAELLQ